MSSATSSKNGQILSIESSSEKLVNSTDAKSIIQGFVQKNGAQESFETLEADCLRTHSELKEFSTKKPEKWKSLLKEARNTLLEKKVKALQQEYIQRLQTVSGLTSKDKEDFKNNISDRVLDEHNDTIEKKIQFLRKSINTYLPSTEESIRHNTARLNAMLHSAQKSELIGTKKVQEWQRRLESSRWTWYEKQQFVRETLPDFIAKWKEVGNVRAKTLQLAAKNTIPKNYSKELDAIRNTGDSYADLSFSKKKSLVETAHAKVNVYSANTQKQYAQVESALQAAVSEKILSKSKVSTWLTRVFSSNHTPADIKKFMGNGANSLTALKVQWRSVKAGFDALEKKRNSVKSTVSFTFVPLETFLRWHFTTRVAYVDEANARLDEVESSKPDPFIQVKAEIDRKDYHSALYLLSNISVGTLKGTDLTRFETLKKYIAARIAEEELHTQSNSQANSQTEIDAMNDALEGLSSISQPYKSILEKAMYKGDYGTVITIMAATEKGSNYKEVEQEVQHEAVQEVQILNQKQPTKVETIEQPQSETKEFNQAESMRTVYTQEYKAITKVIEPEQNTFVQTLPAAALATTKLQKNDVKTLPENPTKPRVEKTTSEQIKEITSQRIKEKDTPKQNYQQTQVTKPALQVMKLDAAGGGADDIISRCNANQGNPGFLNTTLVRVAGIDETTHTSIVSMNRKITAGMRAKKQVVAPQVATTLPATSETLTI